MSAVTPFILERIAGDLWRLNQMSDYSMLLARIAELEGAPKTDAVAPEVVAERDALKAENAILHASAAQLMAENEALRAQIDAFKAAVTAEVQHAETLVPQA